MTRRYFRTDRTTIWKHRKFKCVFHRFLDGSWVDRSNMYSDKQKKYHFQVLHKKSALRAEILQKDNYDNYVCPSDDPILMLSSSMLWHVSKPEACIANRYRHRATEEGVAGLIFATLQLQGKGTAAGRRTGLYCGDMSCGICAQRSRHVGQCPPVPSKANETISRCAACAPSPSFVHQ